MAYGLHLLFFAVVKADELIPNQNHDYYHQVQGQLYITEKECFDFIIWITKDLQLIRIMKDKNWE